MRDFQVWFYIIAAIIFVFTRLKKKAEPPKNYAPQSPEKPVQTYGLPESRPVATANTPSRPLTFEELLQEITSGKIQQSPPVVDYDEALEDEEKDLEDVDYDYRKQDNIYSMYEEAKKDAFNHPSLEETMKVGDTDTSFGRFKEFEQEAKQNLLNEYLVDLRDPNGLKKAVVMSEILQRKF